ncbi:hypothetical protein [Burkholderia cepacia]|nr:hypothetical protein [Burkholderia cepacia]
MDKDIVLRNMDNFQLRITRPKRSGQKGPQGANNVIGERQGSSS